MKLKVRRAQVWATGIEDRPGGLAEKLGKLAKAGTDLDFILSRRSPESPGKGVLFVTPLEGPTQFKAASEAGFLKTEILHAVRVEGPNRPGIGGDMARAIALAGINLRGFSATAIGRRFLAYLAFENAKEAAKGMRALKRLS
jgi:hypothetical protein